MRCKQCGQKLSKGQNVCPSCGSPAPKTANQKLWGILAVILFVLIVSAVLVFFNLRSRSELPTLSFDTLRNLFIREKAETVEVVSIDPAPGETREAEPAEDYAEAAEPVEDETAVETEAAASSELDDPEEAANAEAEQTADAEAEEMVTAPEAEEAASAEPEETTDADAEETMTTAAVEEAADSKTQTLAAPAVDTVPENSDSARLTPLEYYKQIETQNFTCAVEALCEGYAQYAEAVSTPLDRHSSLDYHLELGDTARAFAASAWEINTDWLQNLSLSVEGDILDTRTGASAVLSLNSVALFGLDLVYDASENRLSLRIPELAESWFAVDVNELESESSAKPGSITYSLQSREQLTTLFGLLPSAEDFEALLTKYFHLILRNIGQAELGSGILEAEGVLQHYTTLNVDLDQETIYRIVSSIIGELRWDEQVEQIIRAVAEASGEESDTAYNNFLHQLDTADYNFAKMDHSIGENLHMVLYVDVSGTICGRSFRSDRNEGGAFTLSYALPRDGELFGLELRYTDGNKLYELAGRGTCAEDSLSGSFIFRENAESLARFSMESRADGEDDYELDLTVIPGRGFYRDFLASAPAELRSRLDDLRLVLHADNQDVDFAMEMNLFQKAEQILALTVTETFSEGADVVPVEDALSADDWAEGLSRKSFNGILENLKEAGLPASLRLYLRAYLGYLFSEE